MKIATFLYRQDKETFSFKGRMRRGESETFGKNVLILKNIFVIFARKDNPLRINRLVGLLENWVTR